MLSGLLLIVLGLLIYVYPRMIVAMLAGMLIAAGISMMLLRWRLRRMFRTPEQATNGWMRFLIRF